MRIKDLPRKQRLSKHWFSVSKNICQCVCESVSNLYGKDVNHLCYLWYLSKTMISNKLVSLRKHLYCLTVNHWQSETSRCSNTNSSKLECSHNLKVSVHCSIWTVLKYFETFLSKLWTPWTTFSKLCSFRCYETSQKERKILFPKLITICFWTLIANFKCFWRWLNGRV